MKTQKFMMEITDKTGQFPIDPDKLEKIINDVMPKSHVISIVDVTRSDEKCQK